MFHRLLLLPAAAALVLWDITPSSAQTGDYCQQFPNPARISVVIDRSAAFADNDVDVLQRGVQALRKRLEDTNKLRSEGGSRSARIQIWPVVSYTAQSRPLFDACLPSCPPNISIWDSCQQREVMRDRQKFWAGFDAVLDRAHLMAAQAAQGETPLAETIAKVVRESQPENLVIFSDFLEFHAAGQNLPRISFYSLNPKEWDGYLSRLKNGNYMPSLAGVEVIGFGYGSEIGLRSNQTPKAGIKDAHWREVFKWWVRYFQMAGAAGFVIEREFPGVLPPPPPPPPLPSDRIAK